MTGPGVKADRVSVCQNLARRHHGTFGGLSAFYRRTNPRGFGPGKTPYSIGKELTKMIEKMFEASIPAETLRSRARYMQKKTESPPGETTTPTSTHQNHSKYQENTTMPTCPTSENHSENQKNTSIQRDKQGRFIKVTAPPGPGRSSKYAKDDAESPQAPVKTRTYTNAVYLAEIAINQLSRIEPEDPKRRKAFWGRPGREKDGLRICDESKEGAGRGHFPLTGRGQNSFYLVSWSPWSFPLSQVTRSGL
jgi:hypothetical protein